MKATPFESVPKVPLASLRSYSASKLVNDLVAGALIAALTLPISMGYADIAGVPYVYGLYASCVPALVFALITSTRHIVFGMDSAASAITGGVLVTLGIELGSTEAVEIMPILTLMVAGFLFIMWIFRAGRLVHFVPIPVMHGFVAGISLSVIINQIPLLIATSPADTDGLLAHQVAIFMTIPNANVPSMLLAAATFIIIIVIKRTAPKLPSALIALVVATCATSVLSLDTQGVSVLGTIEAKLPLVADLRLDSHNLLLSAGSAFTIAFVVAVESLLCLETFAMKAGVRADGSRELLSFALANGIGGLFGCPACSASISRTAAGISARARTQVAGIFAALLIALVVTVFAPALHFLPRPALSAIVVVALVEVVDFHRIARYAKHTMPEFAVFAISAIAVFVFGAIVGVAAGVVIALCVVFYRKHRSSQAALLGVATGGDDKPRVLSSEQEIKSKKDASNSKTGINKDTISTAKHAVQLSPPAHSRKNKSKKIDPGVDYIVFTIKGRLTFLNITSRIDRMLGKLDTHHRFVILKLSKLKSIDVTATDKLRQFVEACHARGLHVKVVRKVRPTDDAYTRYELRKVMGDVRTYPSVKEALRGIKRDISDERRESDIPIMTVKQKATIENGGVIEGTLRFLKTGIVLWFSMTKRSMAESFEETKSATIGANAVQTTSAQVTSDEPFSALTLTQAGADDPIAVYKDGKWICNCPPELLSVVVSQLRACCEAS